MSCLREGRISCCLAAAGVFCRPGAGSGPCRGPLQAIATGRMRLGVSYCGRIPSAG